MANLHPTEFVLDDAQLGSFKGYGDGSNWNGFACPYFEREIAERVLWASEANGYRWTYDADRDAFLVRSEEDPADYEPEVFEGIERRTTDGETLIVYAIGAYSWSWRATEEMN